MDFALFGYYLCALVVIVAALNVVLNPNPIYGALGFALGLVFLGFIYILVGQQLFASIQILVYAGAIMVLFLFMIMVLNVQRDSIPLELSKLRVFGGLVAGSLFIKLYLAIELISDSGAMLNAKPIPADTNQIEAVGFLLFGDYLIPFELASVLLFIGVIGAVVLAKKNYFPSHPPVALQSSASGGGVAPQQPKDAEVGA